MLSLYLLLSAFFLVGIFFCNILSLTLTRLGETLSHPLIERHRFFYLPLHHALFRKKNFDLLIFSAEITQSILRLFFAGIALFTLFFFDYQIPSFILSLVLYLFFALLIGDFFPRLLNQRAPEKALSFSLPYASAFLLLSLPLSFLFLKMAEVMGDHQKKAGVGETIEEMKETVVKILQSAEIKGRLNASDKKLIESVITFKDLIVREVMVPRVDLFCLPAETSIRQAAHLLAVEGYSRTPVYRETIDNIIGMLMYKDVLEIYMECEDKKREYSYLDTPIESVVKGVFYTPETKRVSQLLQEFRTKQMHMAIVIDEYGGTAGVVTIEDALEEIVGDIADEYDIDEETLYVRQPDGIGWIADAKMNIKDADDAFEIDIPQEGDYDTIGGYLFHKLDSPTKGAILRHDLFDIEIVSATERSVEKVRIIPHPAPESPSSSDE